MDPWILVRTGVLPAVVAWSGGLLVARGLVAPQRVTAALFWAGVAAGFIAEFGVPLPVHETFEWPLLASAGAALLAGLWPAQAL